MPRYKERLQQIDMTQNELLISIKAVDPRVDKSLLSKMVNNLCLPTPPQLDAICGALDCAVVELYERAEIDLLHDKPTAAQAPRQSRGGLSHGGNVYNLTVEIDRAVAERTLNDEALKLLGYKGKSDFIRKMVDRADARLRYIKRKAAHGADTPEADG